MLLWNPVKFIYTKPTHLWSEDFWILVSYYLHGLVNIAFLKIPNLSLTVFLVCITNCLTTSKITLQSYMEEPPQTFPSSAFIREKDIWGEAKCIHGNIMFSKTNRYEQWDLESWFKDLGYFVHRLYECEPKPSYF